MPTAATAIAMPSGYDLDGFFADEARAPTYEKGNNAVTTFLNVVWCPFGLKREARVSMINN